MSLSLAGDVAPVAGAGDRPERSEPRESREPRAPRSDARPAAADGPGRAVSFEETFEAQLATELGDLGPASQPFSEDDGARRPRNNRRRR